VTGTAAPPPRSPQVDVVESWPARIHRPLDLFRLLALVVVLLLLTGLAVVARETSRGASADLARLLGDLPSFFAHALRLVSAFGALAVPLALIVREIVRGNRRRLIEAVVTGLLAMGVAQGVDRAVAAFPSSALYAALTRLPGGATPQPMDTYLTALFAFAAVVGVAHERLWRRLLGAVTAVYVISAFIAAQATLLSLTSSVVLGMGVGFAVRFAAGIVNDRPDGNRVAQAVARQGFDLVRLEAVAADPDDHREYLATTRTGEQLTVQVFDRELIASGAAYNFYRILRLRAELAPAPALSLERVTEHRSLLAMAAWAIGVRTPRLLAGLPCGADSIVLVYESAVATALQDPTDPQLDELWRSVGKLHVHRVTHRGLTAGKILVDPTGQIVLPIPIDGAMFASDLRVSLDRAQLLITTAQLTGAERAVRSARSNMTDEELAAVQPVLQPIALPGATRRAVKQHAGLLESVREEIQAQTNHRPPELVEVERIRPRAILSIVAIIVAGYLIVSQLSSVNLVTVLSEARWQWLPLVLLASAVTYVAAAVSLMGYVRERLPLARTVLAQVAASFAGFVTPPAVGGLTINVRYLQKSGVAAAGIATSLGLSQAVNAALHVVLLLAVAAATGASTNEGLPVPGWAFGVLGGVAGLGLLALAIPGARRWLSARLLPPLRQSLSRLADLLTTPPKLAQALLGSLALNAAYIAALWFAVRAFHGPIGLSGAAVVYLTGAAIGSVAPTPGGLGAVEVALSTGLAAIGVPSTAAVSGVLLFRVATFWLPVPLGWLALRWLRRRDAV
jgi:uncharacterized membrane protein YbhN (UPF0104 family)/tRNA A-37 threonylcarbamoyl transferase component Bud32